MAARSGLTQSAISRIWRAFALQPHRVEIFKLSTISCANATRARFSAGWHARWSPPELGRRDDGLQIRYVVRSQLCHCSPTTLCTR